MDLSQFVPALLFIVGVILQFTVRQPADKNDGIYVAWTAAACTLVYALTAQLSSDWRANIVQLLVWLGDPSTGAVWKVIAGTAVTSGIANIAVKLGAPENHPLIPVTDSLLPTPKENE